MTGSLWTDEPDGLPDMLHVSFLVPKKKNLNITEHQFPVEYSHAYMIRPDNLRRKLLCQVEIKLNVVLAAR